MSNETPAIHQVARNTLQDVAPIAQQVERFVDDHLFDDFGLIRSSVDVATGLPFERWFISANKVPRRALFDPWSFWTYEDSIMGLGFHIETLVLKHELTGDVDALERAADELATVCNVYSASQIHGIGSFLRPYGGYDMMHEFLEPLGTDQAGPLLCGILRLHRYLDSNERMFVDRMLVQMLDWYREQDFSYWYYKSMIHAWRPPLHHAASYYLPGIAFAAAATGDAMWKDLLQQKLRLLQTDDRYMDAQTMRFGSDLLLLKRLLGSRFSQVFSDHMLGRIWSGVDDALAAYDATTWRKFVHAEAADPKFATRRLRPMNRAANLGFAYFDWIHPGKCRPRHELSTLCAKAALGDESASATAANIMASCKRVPEDFTPFSYELASDVPDDIVLYFRSVGIGMLNWLRDYWLLRAVVEGVAV